MNLERLFDGHEISRSGSADMPPVWSELLSTTRNQALLQICESFGLASASGAAQRILAAHDLGVVIPKKKRQRRDARFWTLAVMYSPRRSLLFSAPLADRLACRWELPGSYLQVAANLGAFQFHQFSGELVWPATVATIAQGLQIAADTPIQIAPFYNHGTGDYDCWVGNDFATTCVFNHETCSIDRYCQGGFTGWFEQRFQEIVSA